jgi:hypothetical protein
MDAQNNISQIYKIYKANIQNKDIALGNLTLDGTMANLTALLNCP